MLQPVETIKLYQEPPSPKNFKAGDVIFHAGEYGNFVYGVVSGEVKLFVGETVTETIQFGDLFGEGAFVHADGLHSETAIAKTDCTLAFLDKRRFLFAVQQTPMFAIEVMRSYSDRLRRFKQSIEH